MSLKVFFSSGFFYVSVFISRLLRRGAVGNQESLYYVFKNRVGKKKVMHRVRLELEGHDLQSCSCGIGSPLFNGLRKFSEQSKKLEKVLGERY